MSSKATLVEYAASLSPCNTHSHHQPDTEQVGRDLDGLLRQSYIGFAGVPWTSAVASRQAFLEQIRHRSYFVWWQRAITQLYGIQELTLDNWDDVSRIVELAHRDKLWHRRILTEHCHYQRVMLDAYWNPGDDNGDPELFSATLRIDDFLRAYVPHEKDGDGVAFADRYQPPKSLGELEGLLRARIATHIARGGMALKSAIAYERGLDFGVAEPGLAAKALQNGLEATAEQVDAFQNWTFDLVCRVASEVDLPFQIHTGLGQLEKTGALQLLPTIKAHPQTRFVLFHGSFPWSDDLCALIHSHRSVWVDLCWLPLISPSRARSFVREMVELGTVDRMTWGCDTWTGEESLGALLAVRDALGVAFGELVDEGWMTLADAEAYVRRILVDNAQRLYRDREFRRDFPSR